MTAREEGREAAFTVVGYVIVEGYTFRPGTRPDLPGVVFTPTACVCDLHPARDALPWTARGPEGSEAYRRRLGLDERAFWDLQAATQRAFDEETWGLDEVFASRAPAEAFFGTFFAERPNVRLLELAVPSPVLPAFLAATENDVPCGMALAARRGASQGICTTWTTR